MKTLLAFLVAILVPTSVMVAFYLFGQFTMFKANDPYIWVRTSKWFLICLMVSSAYVVVLGTPTYFVMRRLNAIRWWSKIIAGFVLGAVPMAIFSWPLQYSGASAMSDGVETLVNGVPTSAGWLQYLLSVACFGGLGAVSAFAFWLVVRDVAHKAREAEGQLGAINAASGAGLAK